MKVAPFVPTVGEILPGTACEVPGLEAVVAHWTEGACSAEEWFREVGGSWGTAGFAVRRGEDLLGFVVYGPRKSVPRAGRYPLGPLDDDAVLLAYVGGDARTRRRLLVRMLRDLRQRGVAKVEAVSSDRGAEHHAHTGFLVESGWRPVRRAAYRGGFYTLARTDLASAVEVREVARALVGRVRFPSLNPRVPVPGAFGAARRLSAEGDDRLGPRPLLRTE